MIRTAGDGRMLSASGNSAMDFDHFEALIVAAGDTGSLAELHGTLCGHLSGGRLLDIAAVQKIAADVLALGAAEITGLTASLQQLHRDADAGLRDEDYSFAPLLPADELPLAQRIESLAHWCQGYISGLGQSGLAGDTELSADFTAAIRDMAAIAHADPQAPEDDDSEADFIELVEYVRVAALLVFTEVAAQGARPRSAV